MNIYMRASGDLVTADEAHLRQLFEQLFGPVCTLAEGDIPANADLLVNTDADAFSVSNLDFGGLQMTFARRLPSVAEFIATVGHAAGTLSPRARDMLRPLVDHLRPPRLRIFSLVCPLYPLLPVALNLRLTAKRFMFLGDVTAIVVGKGQADQLRRMLGGMVEVAELDSVADDERPDIFVLPWSRYTAAMWLEPEQIARLLSWVNANLLEATTYGFLRPISLGDGLDQRIPRIDPAFHPHADTHAPARSMLRLGRVVANVAPLRLSMRGNSIGCEDPCGFRTALQFDRLGERPREHLVVALCGGSVAWGEGSYDDDNVAGALATLLEQRIARQGLGLRVHVVNLAQPGWLLADEMVAYLLHGSILRPDFVISTSGINDAFQAIDGDPYFLRHHNITLDSMVLRVEFKATDEDFRSVDPRQLAKSLAFRINQFRDIVAAGGGSYLYALQPAWYGKPATPNESQSFSWLRDQLWGQFQSPRVNKLPPFYNGMRRALLDLAQRGGLPVVDCHDIFCRLSVDRDIFIDHAHLTPEGNADLASVYADWLMPQLLQRAQEV